MHFGFARTSQPQIARPGRVADGPGRGLGFNRIAGGYDCHPGERAHDGQIFGRMMARPKRPVGEAAAHGDNLHVRVVIADIVAHLFEATQDREVGDRVCEYDLAAERQARRRCRSCFARRRPR